MCLCQTELFERELFLCIKMNSALNNLQWLICNKTKLNPTTQTSLTSDRRLKLVLKRYIVYNSYKFQFTHCLHCVCVCVCVCVFVFLFFCLFFFFFCFLLQYTPHFDTIRHLVVPKCKEALKDIFIRHCYHYSLRVFFTPVLANSLLLVSKWQQVFSSLHDSSQYSDRS